MGTTASHSSFVEGAGDAFSTLSLQALNRLEGLFRHSTVVKLALRTKLLQQRYARTSDFGSRKPLQRAISGISPRLNKA